MKDLLCVDGLDDVDSVYAGKEVVMNEFQKAFKQNLSILQFTDCSFHSLGWKFFGILDNFELHPPEISKRSTDNRETSSFG